MEITSNSIYDFGMIGTNSIEKLHFNFGNIFFLVFIVIGLILIKKFLQSEMKGYCPYCGKDFILTKDHHDKICTICGKEFRLRNMRIYKAEDVVDELLYYMAKSFAYLTLLSDNITEKQKQYVQEFAMRQKLTRHQFEDMCTIYNKTVKSSSNVFFRYIRVINNIKMYIEDYGADKEMGDVEETENGVLNVMYDFAMIDGSISEGEMAFFKYYTKVFNISKNRFDFIVNNFNDFETKRVDFSEANRYDEYNRYEEKSSQNSTQENINMTYNTKSQEYYKILECDSNVSDDEFKKQYKKLMMQYHPDKYAANDLPEEIQRMLNNKMSELNEAYEYIKKERGMN